jgi:formylglycine-generating enzyme required for sulfatase activity
MKYPAAFRVVTIFLAAFTLITQPSAQADMFGTSGNEFTIDFVDIGNAGNAANPVGITFFGAVPYEYRMGKYEISQDAIDKATASGMANVTAGAWTGNQPAATITWYEAAAFVNWLNTSTGKTAAYDLAWNGSAWSMNLWSSEQAWTAGGTNLYRNKDAFYFLPSENEWVKAAFYNPAGSNYFDYPTASSSIPTAVASGTNAGTAVYNNNEIVPAIVDSAGGLSPYGTMGQGGNVVEWNESAFDRTNSLSTESRAARGGYYGSVAINLRSFARVERDPAIWLNDLGFRVASVPEPSTYALLALAAAGLGAHVLRRRRK